MRGVKIEHNAISRPMQPTTRGQLEDGGCVYTNSPCPNCSVSHNYFDSDPQVYGCVYHDGGSGLWNDHFNVFNHIATSAVFAHGSSPHTTVVDMWLNDTKGLALEGDTNRDVHSPNGSCVDPAMNFTRTGTEGGPHGDDLYRIWFGPWANWPAPAQAVVDAAGRRASFPTPQVPAVTPPKQPNAPTPHDCAPPPGGRTGKFAATPCSGLPSQLWELTSGVVPGDGKPTSVQMDHAAGGCWEVEGCSGETVNCNWGCKPLPKDTAQCAKSPCDCNGAWTTNKDGTISSLVGDSCIEVTAGANSAVIAAKCTGSVSQKFLFKPAGAGVGGRQAWTVTQDAAGVALCIDVDGK